MLIKFPNYNTANPKTQINKPQKKLKNKIKILDSLHRTKQSKQDTLVTKFLSNKDNVYIKN